MRPTTSPLRSSRGVLTPPSCWARTSSTARSTTPSLIGQRLSEIGRRCAGNNCKIGRVEGNSMSFAEMITIRQSGSRCCQVRVSQYLLVSSAGNQHSRPGVCSMMVNITVALAIGLVVGFIPGYGVRALISYRRRLRAKRRSYLF